MTLTPSCSATFIFYSLKGLLSTVLEPLYSFCLEPESFLLPTLNCALVLLIPALKSLSWDHFP